MPRKRNGSRRTRRDIPSSAAFPAPRGLTSTTFELGSEEYAVFSFPLPEIAVPAGLTASETDVVRAVLGGCSNAEIARARGTSSNTIANQLRSVYSKLGVDGRLALVQACAEAGRGETKDNARAR
jgi:DNA-binding CsgD family transcriptional regulator